MKSLRVFLFWCAIQLTCEGEQKCEKFVSCPCGIEGENVRVCVLASEVFHEEVCTKFSRCKSCVEGSDICVECPEGFEGPFCNREGTLNRQKRQVALPYSRANRRSVPESEFETDEKSCSESMPDGASKNLESIACVPWRCTGKCPPGYHFALLLTVELTLTCYRGIWEPHESFPECISISQPGSVGTRPRQPFLPQGRPGTSQGLQIGSPVPAPGSINRPATGTTRRPISVTGTSTTPREGSRRTLYEILEDPDLLIKGRPVNLTKIFELFRKAGIENILDGPGPMTVFMPSDDAFGRLPKSAIEQLEENPELLREVLRHHVTQSQILPSVEPESYTISSLEGNQLLITMLNGGKLIIISGAKAVAVTKGSNGIFYVINQLLYPLPQRDIISAINSRPDLTTLAYLLPLSGLENKLRGQTPYTLLAPTDNAFSQLPQSVYDELTRNTTALQEILLNHIIEGAHYVREFFTGGTYQSAGVGKLKFQVVGRIRDNIQVNEINIKIPEIVTGSGVIHLIDQVLLDESDFTNIQNALAGIKYCEYPGDIGNGKMVHSPPPNERRRPIQPGEQYPAGSRMDYKCNEGYEVGGPSVLECEKDGSWSDIPPTCIPAEEIMHCKNLGPIQNGRVQYVPPAVKQRSGPGPSLDYDLEEYPEGAVLEYDCYEGYKLNGQSSLTCQPSGVWSSKQPVCEQDCGHSLMQTFGKVSNGENTNYGAWPWVVSIHLDNAGSRFICGGAVLNAHTVLTAAHCLEGSGRLLLRFGKHHFNVEKDDMEVLTRKSSRIIIHPDYSNVTYDNDIGLVTFRHRIPYSVRVQPICLPSLQSSLQNLQPRQIGYIGGWGDTELALPPEKMLLAKLPVVSDEECRNEYRERRVALTRNMFCAGYADASQNVCQGDSGSPLVFFNPRTDRYTLEGLVSYGLRGKCGEAGKYAIFTKVFRFVLWIAKETNS